MISDLCFLFVMLSATLGITSLSTCLMNLTLLIELVIILENPFYNFKFCTPIVLTFLLLLLLDFISWAVLFVI